MVLHNYFENVLENSIVRRTVFGNSPTYLSVSTAESQNDFLW